MHYTLPQLIALDERYPTQRKLLLVPSINFGRELLAALAHERGAWIGWEPATLATIAQKLALVELARRGLRRASDVAVADTISTAFDDAVAESGKHTRGGTFSPELAALTWSAGTRGAVVDAILELRSAQLTSQQVRSVGDVGVVWSLGAILSRYEELLESRKIADSNAVFRAAIEAFDAEAPMVLDHTLMVATSGWSVRGASRTLFEKMVGKGLQVLVGPTQADQLAPPGLVDLLADAPQESVERTAVTRSPVMFCAGSPADEVREIVRRALAAGHSLNDIEIASTDRDTYGVALEALCTHIGATTTLVDGLPLGVTRIGRALERWFSWLETDLTATHVRDALESGDWQIELRGEAVTGTQLAGELRRLRIGWGFDATRRSAERLRSPEWRTIKTPFDDESPEALAARQIARHRNADALLSLLDLLLAQLPAPDGDEAAAISVAELSSRTLAILKLVHPHGPAERATLQRLSERLLEVAAVPNTRVSLMQALATLRQELGDLRAWTNASETSRPRRATGGHIHFTNLDSAGATGRPLLFLVGLDADRTAGPVLQSPLLPDSLRVRLNDRGADLPTVEHRRRERAWQLNAALAGSSAKVTLSYAIRGGSEGRDASPAPALLQVAREATGKPGMGYEELRQHFGPPVSPVPNSPVDAIDARDVLLAHMSDGALLLDGTDAARALFPMLDRGLNAVAERQGEIAGAYHGIVPDAGRMDPRRTQKPISPSSLETIAACSLRWFYATALNARLPEEPVFDAMVWLNVLERGSALHLIYERIVSAKLYEQAPSADRRAQITAIVNGVADEFAKVIPVANRTIRAREIVSLDNDAQLFVNSEHDAFRREPWEVVALESAFGYDNGDEGATLPLDDGTSVRVHGRVDRVDKLRDGTLRLVDYKTGRAFELNTKRGAFDGGRKLQLAVYSPAVSRQFAAAVSVAEYHFPTKKGDGFVARADRELLDAAPRIVRSLLDDVAAGRFVATIDKSDCAYCNFAAICRTRVDDWNATTSPRAEWAKERAATSEHYVGVLNRTSRIGDDS